MSETQNNIMHVALVLDASVSMGHLREQVVKVADEQIKWLAERSQRMDIETRITVYSFGSTVNCLVYDKDVLRLPSLKQLYKINGNTALIEAVIQSQDDLAETPERYGKHSFLTFVITDGEENWSGNEVYPKQRHLYTDKTLAARLAKLPSHWTVAVMVPNQMGKIQAMDYGFPADNIAIWDSTSTRGVEEAGRTIRAATDNFMDNVSKGVRGTRSVFSTGADAVNRATVAQADLKPLDPSEYMLLRVNTDKVRADEFVKANGLRYVTGSVYYELVKSEKIQVQKQVLVRDKKSGHVYTGPDARALVGLPDMNVSAKPEPNPDFQIFVQSTAPNRNLLPGNNVVIMNPRTL